ncbi:hypothetical protein [Saccharothrix variisporea]|nr:hypothetical protein [Saccharothrix variisporea]
MTGNRGPSTDGWVLTFSAPGVSVPQGWNRTRNNAPRSQHRR